MAEPLGKRDLVVVDCLAESLPDEVPSGLRASADLVAGVSVAFENSLEG